MFGLVVWNEPHFEDTLGLLETSFRLVSSRNQGKPQRSKPGNGSHLKGCCGTKSPLGSCFRPLAALTLSRREAPSSTFRMAAWHHVSVGHFLAAAFPSFTTFGPPHSPPNLQILSCVMKNRCQEDRPKMPKFSRSSLRNLHRKSISATFRRVGGSEVRDHLIVGLERYSSDSIEMVHVRL